MNNAVRELTTRLVDMLDMLHSGVMLIDREGGIAHVNPRLSKMLRRDPTQLIGKQVQHLYPDEETRARIERWRAEFEESRDHEFHLPLPDGQRLPVLIAGRWLGPDPALADYRIVTVMDISGQKEAQRQTREQYHEIAKLSDTVLEQALTLRDHSKVLEKKVRQRTRELTEANMEAIYMLAVASETRDRIPGPTSCGSATTPPN